MGFEFSATDWYGKPLAVLFGLKRALLDNSNTSHSKLFKVYKNGIFEQFKYLVDFRQVGMYNLDNKSRKMSKEKEPHQTAIRCDSIHQLLPVDDDIF